MSKIEELTKETFNEEIADGITMVDFFAPWCGPCKMVAPVLEELYEEADDIIKIRKVNVDDEQELALEYGVRSVPTFLFFKNGDMVDRMTGAAPKEAFVNKIEEITNL